MAILYRHGRETPTLGVRHRTPAHKEFMEIIKSSSNAIVKKAVKLLDKKYRQEYGQYLAEGKRYVFDSLVSGTMSRIVKNVLIKQSVFNVLESELVGFIELVTVISDDIFDKISDTQNSQGVVAIMDILPETNNLVSKQCILLDRIRDPGNMGTIIRTACAAGYTDIICLDCVDVYNPKVVRSCMTGLLHTVIHTCMSAQDVLKADYKLIAADICGENGFEVKLPHEKICLVIGNEANGISEEILNLCEFKIKIPMQNIESLNAAVSAGILMYLLKYNR